MKKLTLIPLLSVLFSLCAAEKANVSNKLVGVFPENIKCIAVLSPASPPNEKLIRQGIAMLEKAGIKVKLMPHAFVKNGKRGAAVKQRLEDWNAAVNDPEVDMILPTRGGSGAQNLVPLIDWKKFKERNLVLMGFSNITHLTSAMEFHKAGYPIAGPNLGRLVTATPESLSHLKSVLAKKSPKPIKLVPLREGDASGKAYAGHISMLAANVAGKCKVIPENRVIFMECVSRDTAVVSQNFDFLKKNGFFDKASAVILCHFSRLKDAQNRDKMFEDWTSQLKCPVYKGYPYGHENSNYAIDFARTAVIKNNVLYFE